MSKEITLEQLAQDQSKQHVVKPAEQIAEKAPIKPAQTSGNMKAMSTSDLAKSLPGKEKEDDMKTPELIKNALSDMESTLSGRIETFEKEVKPIIMENAREIALENELNEISEGAGNDDELELVDDAELEDILNDESEEDEDFEFAPVSAPVKDDGIPVMKQDDEIVEEEETVVMEEEVTVKEEVAVEEDEKDLFDDIDNALDDLDAVDDITEPDEETEQEAQERFKKSMEHVHVTSVDGIDFNSIKIRQTPVASSTVLNAISNAKASKKADWVLLEPGRSITMRECSGPEINTLRRTIQNSNEINASIATLKFLYEHIVDPNKPKFEVWCKCTRYEDIESLYYAVYKACYSDCNLVARSCERNEDKNTGCNKGSIIDTDIEKMVKIEDEETQKKFDAIFKQDTTTYNASIESEIIPASDYIAISYTKPTLYSTYLQYSALNADVRSRYDELLSIMATVNGFYSINRDKNGNPELIPIKVKEYPNSVTKTIVSKLKVFNELLKTLTNDQYEVLTAKLRNNVTETKIKYVLPETTCPECGSTIPEEEASMLQQLFTRAQLVAIKSL